MCGITGFIDYNIQYDTNQVSQKMGDAIFSRGPDGYGVWQDNNLGIHLIHRRLAIIDLSSAGHQPMLSVSGRYVIVFNGEIYNFKKIKQELEAIHGSIAWRGHSDTEVILMAIESYGFEQALLQLEGMFAIGLWDRQDQKFYLARDRMGEKPLYYGYFNGAFGFASELKALRCHPKFNPEINRNAIGQLMLHNCIPAPLSIFNGIHKLIPGHYLCLDYRQIIKNEEVNSIPYWQLSTSLSNRYEGSLDDAVNDLEKLLVNSIKNQMIADVPLGCFLSGGVDSSTIAALMQRQSTTPIQTFSIGFDDPSYDEAVFAKEIAKHIGSSHNELYISEKDALNVIPNLAKIYDEPFADSSQIPTFLVSQLAKQKVTVALSGDGGDELFAGYNRYLLAENLYSKIKIVPLWLRKLCSKGIPLISPKFLENVNKLTRLPITNFSDKVYRLEPLFKAKNFDEFYFRLASHWINLNELVIGLNNDKSLWDKDVNNLNQLNDKILKMQYLDGVGYLPDDILVKVDRAAMANSLETRVPLLNHKIVEFAYSLPREFKINQGVTKRILRQVLYKHVPQDLIERPKRGFAVPLNDWLRGELKDWAFDLLDPYKLKAQGYLNSELISQKLQQHVSGKADNGYYLWDILMFQQWLMSYESLK